MQSEQQHVLVLAKLKQMRPQRRLARKRKALSRRLLQRRAKFSLAYRPDRKRRPRFARLKDQLPGNPTPLGEYRAQALVPLHHIEQRTVQGAMIERPA